MVRAQLWPVQETLGAYIEQKAHITEQQAESKQMEAPKVLT